MAQRRWGRAAAVAAGALIAAVFAYLNGGERVSINLGFTVLYRVPLVALVFVSWLLGMVTMFLFGLRHDLRVRRALRQYRVQEEIQSWRSEEPPPDSNAEAFRDPREA